MMWRNHCRTLKNRMIPSVTAFDPVKVSVCCVDCMVDTTVVHACVLAGSLSPVRTSLRKERLGHLPHISTTAVDLSPTVIGQRRTPKGLQVDPLIVDSNASMKRSTSLLSGAPNLPSPHQDAGARFIVASLGGDGILFTNRFNKALMGTLVVYRTDEAKVRFPGKVLLERRDLVECPYVAGEEDTLHTLALNRNAITSLQHMSQYVPALYRLLCHDISVTFTVSALSRL